MSDDGSQTPHVFDWGEWDGDVRDGDAHGDGEITFRNGFRYEGQVQHNMMHGRGRLVLGDSGEEYEGEFQDDLRHGQGTHSWPSGSRYSGEWVRGKTKRPRVPRHLP